MKKTLFAIVMFLPQFSFSQNLVSNSSFEDTLNCAQFFGTPNAAYPWFNPTSGTPDYFFGTGSSCGFSSINNPDGYQLPRTGNAYVGLFTYVLPSTREYVAIKLDSVLSNGCNYYTEFSISRANNFRLATDKMGCVFVNDTSGFYLNGYSNLPFIPAIQTTPGILITDTLNWVKVSGIYGASGGEKYLIIGNFYDSANTFFDTISTSGYNSAYYYIDDVKVLSCDSTALILTDTQIKENQTVSIYPNPAKDYINIFYNESETINYIEIFEISGRYLKKQKLRNDIKQNSISLLEFKDGTYILKINFKNNENYYYKTTIIH